MSLDHETEAKAMQQRWGWRALRHLCSIALMLLIAVGVVWVLQPLRKASALPAPPLPPYTPEPPDFQEMLVLGPTTFVPGTRGAVRVLVHDPRSRQPLSGVEVRISLVARNEASDGEILYRGDTNDLGTVEASFQVPAVAEGEWTMAVDAAGPVGEQHVARMVTIERSLAVVALTPKRVYHPGEQVPAWFWVGGQLDRRPAADQPVAWTLRDAHGNRVCEGVVQTSAYGVARATCALVEGVGEGTYRLVATVGDLAAESELSVEANVPSTLHVEVRSAQGYGIVGQPMDAQVRASDLYGNPVANAAVEIEGRTGLSGKTLFRRAGQTDATGLFSFVVSGEELLSGGAEPVSGVRLVAWAIDAQGHSGRDEAPVPVAEEELGVLAWPESAVLSPGVENRVHVRVLYPDGRPARCKVELTAPGLEQAVGAETDSDGLAWIPITPGATSRLAISVHAVDAAGSTGSARFDLAVAEGTQHLQLRAERERYTAGETMQVEVLAEAVQAAYLDLSIGGQQVGAYAAQVVGGRARYEVALPQDWEGAVELDAYAFLPDGTLLRDARLVQVTPSPSLQVTARRLDDAPDAREVARIALETTDDGGTGTPALVRASITARGHGESGVADPAVQQDMPRLVPAVDLMPQYAETASRLRPISATVLQAFEAYREAWTLRRSTFSVAAEWISWGAVGLCLLSWLVTLPLLWQRGSSPLPPMLGALLIGPVLIGIGMLGLYLAVTGMGPGATLALGTAWLGALLATFLQARLGGKARWMAFFGTLALGDGVLAVALHYAVARGVGTGPSLSPYGWAALGGVCLALSGFGVDCLRDGRPQQAWATFSLVLLLAATVSGTALADWDQGGAAYQELPPLRPRVDPPAPLPIESETPLVMTVDASASQFALPMDGQELLAWVPGAETDDEGAAVIEVPLAETTDSVRVTTLALDERGRWGSEQLILPLTKPLWATVELPTELTVGDQLALPVTVHNALPISSSVRISVTEGAWFVLRPASAMAQQASLPSAGEHTFVLPIRVDAWGDQDLVVSIESEGWSEVITRPVSVRPNGDWVAGAYSWWVEEESGYKFRIPWAAYEDTDRIVVRVYTGPQSVLSQALVQASQQLGSTFDQLVGGIEARLAYASYLQRIGEWSGPARAQLERALDLDNQRLLAFEAMSGGFSVLPGTSPDLYRSAIALRCLSELAAFTRVDAEAADRTAAWLLAQQGTDGTWQIEEPPSSWAALAHAELPMTAHVAWALLDAGFADSPGVQAAVQHVRQYLDSVQDPYVLALATNALLSAGERTDELAAALARLADQAEVSYGLTRWQSGLQALSGASGGDIEAGGYRAPSIRVEVTALATLALARGGGYPEYVDAGLARLTDSRDVAGTWNAPSATTLALRAFLVGLPQSTLAPTELPLSARVSISMNDGGARKLTLQGDVGAEVSYAELEKGYNDVQITVEGDRVAYQIVGTYCLQWSQVPLPLPEEEELSLEISYDRTSVSVGESITATVGVMLNRSGVAPLVMLELGLPPGLTLVEADMERLVGEGVIAGWERTGERLRVYLLDLGDEQPVYFSYRLRAGYALRVLSQPSYGIDVANPQRPAVRAPAALQVR